jgi:hypothetical protein
MKNLLEISPIIWIAAIVLAPLVAGLVYWFRRNFQLNEVTLWVAKFKRKENEAKKIQIQLLTKPSAELGEPFRRYFATVLKRPFYPLPDHLEVLEQAKVGLRGPHHVPIVVLNGAGGVGKTTIAGEIIRQSTSLGFLKPLGDSAKRQVYENDRIRPIDEPARLEWGELVNTILIQLGSPSLTNRRIGEREGWTRRQLHLEKYLVLVDNLESVDNAQEVATRLRDLLEGSDSRALITYRYRDLKELCGVFSVSVTGLSESDSLTFLQKELKARGYGGLRKWVEEKGDDRETLLRIIALTRSLPLALQLVIGLRVSLPLASVYHLLCDITTDTRVEEIYEFLYREELRLLSAYSRVLLVSAFSKQLGYFRSELIDTVGTSAEDALVRLAELGRASLVHSVSRQRAGVGREDYFYVHPMLHQLLNRIGTESGSL